MLEASRPAEPMRVYGNGGSARAAGSEPRGRVVGLKPDARLLGVARSFSDRPLPRPVLDRQTGAPMNLKSAAGPRVVHPKRNGRVPTFARARPCPAGRQTLLAPISDGDGTPPRDSLGTQHVCHLIRPPTAKVRFKARGPQAAVPAADVPKRLPSGSAGAPVEQRRDPAGMLRGPRRAIQTRSASTGASSLGRLAIVRVRGVC